MESYAANILMIFSLVGFITLMVLAAYIIKELVG